MKTTELFKKLGGLYLADDYIAYKADTNQLDDFDFEFWRLKDSHEIVEKLGGLDKAKEVFSEIEAGDYAERLKQAIADVESCQ